MLQAPEPYNNYIERVFHLSECGKQVRSFTFQVTEDCPLRCIYCYQPVKLKHFMDFETAKTAIDMLFDQANDPEFAFSYDKTFGIIFDFIGGEPFLAIDVVTQIIDYIEDKLIKTNSPWILFHKYSFSTNGVLYFEPKVQELINKYSDLISVAVTVDGNKELHDSCRLFPDGSGSYDLAIKAALDLKERFDSKATKITLSPYNIDKLADAVFNMFNLGFNYVQGNCCFEEGWELKHATIFYYELKKIADFILKNGYEDVYGTSFFSETSFHPYTKEDDKNFCGGTGEMIALDYKGKFYPCIRYMPSSLNGEQPPLEIGSLSEGIYQTEKHKETYKLLKSITKSSQSPEKCMTCPVAEGCSWCSGYNYQKFGTPNKRATFICDTHKARALANLYFWSLYAILSKTKPQFKNYLTDEIALPIIGTEEWNALKNLWEEASNGCCL